MFCRLGFLLLISAAALSGAAHAEERVKSLDFQDELIEGMNKKPLDSLSQNASRKKSEEEEHLYKRKRDLRPDITSALKELRWQ